MRPDRTIVMCSLSRNGSQRQTHDVRDGRPGQTPWPSGWREVTRSMGIRRTTRKRWGARVSGFHLFTLAPSHQQVHRHQAPSINMAGWSGRRPSSASNAPGPWTAIDGRPRRNSPAGRGHTTSGRESAIGLERKALQSGGVAVGQALFHGVLPLLLFVLVLAVVGIRVVGLLDLSRAIEHVRCLQR